MLTVYRSNRAEFLARVLAAGLRDDPPPPFEPVAVVVNTWPTSRWLGEQLAIHLGGVAANLRFPFPGSLLRALVDRVLAEETVPAGVVHGQGGAAGTFDGAGDGWRAQRLVWPLLEVLPEVAAGALGEPLRRWLNGRNPSANLDLATWQLGRALADAFDDYGLYRPAMLRHWQAGRALEEDGEPLPPEILWQPELYRALRNRAEGEPFGLRVERAIERLGQGPVDGLEGSPPLRLFGVSSLAPVQVQLLQALSGQIPVELYLLTPCRDLWQRCGNRRRRLREALLNPLGTDWLREAPGLEARFGRLGAEFQQLLEGTGEAQLGEWREGDLFFLPASVDRQSKPRECPPLLHQLQEQLTLPSARKLERSPGDASLEFHPCPGALRQVQVVRDRILQLLAADESLEPRHVLVMTPQVDRLAPLVASVFGDIDATGVELPWRLTDRSQQEVAGIGRTLLALLRLAGERFTATALEGILECRPLQQRFALEPEEAARLPGVLQHCGFRWGLDGRERGGDPTHGLAWAIDRLLLGLVLPACPGLAPAETAPFTGSASLELTGRWLHLLQRLRHWLGELRRSAPLEDWAQRLEALLRDLFGEGGEQAWELPLVLAAIEEWRQAAAGASGDLQLEAPVVAAVLEEGLGAESGRFGHRSGALTISALEPMRAIPHRVVVLMGLDAGVFPRQRSRPGFHRMEGRRRMGDPAPADQDRYALMEALLSARDHLLLTWSCRDERTGEELQPSSPVRQWLQWLQGELEPQQAAGLVAPHPTDPLDRRNFLPDPRGERPAPSCDRRLLRTLRLLEGGDAERPQPLALGPMPTPATASAAPAATGTAAAVDPPQDWDGLVGWLKEPQKQWLRQLGLRPAEWETPLEDLEPLELDERLRSRLLSQAREDPEDPPAGPADWLERRRGQGVLPARAAGELEARALQERWASLEATLATLGPAWRVPLELGGWRATPERRGETVVVVASGKESAPWLMDLWLQVLLAAAAAPSADAAARQGALVAREKERFAVRRQLRAPDPAEARRELERLAALRLRWQQACWPVPPRTGLAWLLAERAKPGTGAAKATQEWEGGFQFSGERERPEMATCFGADLPAAVLLEGDLGEGARELYGRMVEALG